MTGDVANDKFVVIRIEGMHCHRCEQAIQRALKSHDGVHEVEVDFASGQASVLFNRENLSVKDLMASIIEAGYQATGFTQGEAAL